MNYCIYLKFNDILVGEGSEGTIFFSFKPVFNKLNTVQVYDQALYKDNNNMLELHMKKNVK